MAQGLRTGPPGAPRIGLRATFPHLVRSSRGSSVSKERKGEERRWRAARKGDGGAEAAGCFWSYGYGLGPRVAYNKSSRVYINRASD